MDVQKLQMESTEAKKLYEQYRVHRGRMTNDDKAIASIYKRIAQGKLVIRALASITAAGLDNEGLPKLAICRADFKKVRLYKGTNAATFRGIDRYGRDSNRAAGSIRVDIPGSAYGQPKAADVPLIPVHLRPRTDLQKYHVLWEADWYHYPVDPYLLRRIGTGDAWMVVAAWDLTAVERAVMSQRLNA